MIDTIHKELRARLRTTTLYAIARDSGVGFQTLRRWYLGERRNMNLDSLDRLASYLGLQLVNQSDTMNRLEHMNQSDTTELQPGEPAPWDMLPTD